MTGRDLRGNLAWMLCSPQVVALLSAPSTKYVLTRSSHVCAIAPRVNIRGKDIYERQIVFSQSVISSHAIWRGAPEAVGQWCLVRCGGAAC